jgi:hypothetical protein
MDLNKMLQHERRKYERVKIEKYGKLTLKERVLALAK